VKHLYEANASELSAQQGYPTEALAALLSECIRDAEQAVITDASYLEFFGLPPVPCHASELWRRLIHDWWKEEPEQHDIWSAPLNVLLERGTLARRIQRAVGEDCSRAHLEELYRSLCDCLRHGRPFLGPNQ
jgi:carboxylate-amine ligase